MDIFIYNDVTSNYIKLVQYIDILVYVKVIDINIENEMIQVRRIIEKC